MKLPQRPPPRNALFAGVTDPETYLRMIRAVPGPTVAGKYLHWDKLRYRDPPEGLTLPQWWLGLKMHRMALARAIPLRDKAGQAFTFGPVDPLPERLHALDFSAGGTIRMPEPVANPAAKRQYLVRSLIEEAFTSSQLEGAGTTRERAKEMIRKGQPPRNRGERMVLNNYRTMEHILQLRDEPLTKEVVFEIQRRVTEQTLDDPSTAGRFRKGDEYRVVAAPFDDVVYHEPPDAGELERRMELMCAFANGAAPEGFIHPAIRSMILHFWLAYDHPFFDGNGRTARALFYWSMLRHGYWLFEFVSISSVILKGPMQYERAFLEAETDENDLTYFLLYHAEVIARAVDELHAYIQRKTGQLRAAEAALRGAPGLNHRQRALIVAALRQPAESVTVESHRRTHGVVTQTARTDLMDLVARGLLRMEKRGRAFHFLPAPDLEERLRRLPG